MKEQLKKVWHFVKTSTLLKYVVVTAFAVVFIGFVDENSVLSHLRNKQTISSLEQEISQYNAQHKENQTRIKELDRDPKAIEKIARERYFMKEDDEDIFILSDDQPEDENAFADDEAAE